MNLYILKQLNKVNWDEVRAVLVRAESEQHAREIIASDPGYEGAECWRNEERSSCKLVTATGEPGALLWDVKHG